MYSFNKPTQIQDNNMKTEVDMQWIKAGLDNDIHKNFTADKKKSLQLLQCHLKHKLDAAKLCL
jgi:hypothetical protein